MDIRYRQARVDDAAAAASVFADAVNDLNQTRGFGDRPITPAPHPFFAFSVNEQPEGCWVAEHHGEVVGFTISWVCGSFWFLAFLFVSPRHHGKGIGRELLAKALTNHGQTTVTNRGLITFAYNPTAISLYMRHAMYPREPVYWMIGSAHAIRAALPRTESLEYEPEQIDADHGDLSSLDRVDASVLGYPREAHHRYLLGAPGSSCHLFRKHGAPHAYAYVWSNGRVGPLSATTPSVFEGILKRSLALSAAGDAEEVFIVAPGSNERAMALALTLGMRVAHPSLLMSSKPFGTWTCYLFHSPGLM